MMRCAARHAVVIVACLGLAACASTGNRAAKSIDGDAALEARAVRLAELPRWTLTGRIAVSDGREGGSGRIEWAQDRGTFDIGVRAPVAGGSWRLSGDPGLSRLDGVGEHPLLGDRAATLLERELGWHLPLDEVRAWIRGVPLDDSHALVDPDADGLPRSIVEAGWRVEYRAWMDAGESLQMPRRLVARKAPYEVRIAVDRWSLHGPE